MPARLFERTGGNPFFVTEALAAADVDVPETVRDAVLARTAQLEPAPRRLLEAAAVVPSRIELWLLEAVGGEDFVHLEACLGSGMLEHEDGTVAFRHELARLAVEEAIAPAPAGRSSTATCFARCRASARGPIDPARLSHHADAAGDVEAVLRYAPEAGERAAGLCVHREAAEQFARALRHAAALEPERRAELWERRSYESYLSQQFDDAVLARRAALALHQERGDRVREGDSRRWLSRLAWFAADRATAVREARRAVELLEAEPPGRELAMAYSNASQLSMLAGDVGEALECGDLAIELAERLGETEILVHALNNVGSAEVSGRLPGGVAKLERSLALALEYGYEEHVARAYTNLGAGEVWAHDFANADRHLSTGIAYCDEHDLDPWRVYMSGWVARVRFDQGRWDEAAERRERGPAGAERPRAEQDHAARGARPAARTTRRSASVASRSTRRSSWPARATSSSASPRSRPPGPRPTGSTGAPRPSRPRPPRRSRSRSRSTIRGRSASSASGAGGRASRTAMDPRVVAASVRARAARRTGTAAARPLGGARMPVRGRARARRQRRGGARSIRRWRRSSGSARSRRRG